LAYLYSILLGFLLGSIPTAYLVGRLGRGIDLRTVGSGNLGFSNAYRNLGRRLSAVVLAVDLGKGAAATLLAGSAFSADPSGVTPVALAGGIAAVAGHMASPWVGFRGGKGVAAGAGVFLVLAPLATAVAVLTWVAVLLVKGFASLSSLSAAVALPIAVYLTKRGDAGWTIVLAFSIVVSITIILRHISNIRRLVRGEEPKLTSKRRA